MSTSDANLQAVRYLLGEMSPDEARQFLERAEYDGDIQEALRTQQAIDSAIRNTAIPTTAELAAIENSAAQALARVEAAPTTGAVLSLAQITAAVASALATVMLVMLVVISDGDDTVGTKNATPASIHAPAPTTSAGRFDAIAPAFPSPSMITPGPVAAPATASADGGNPDAAGLSAPASTPSTTPAAAPSARHQQNSRSTSHPPLPESDSVDIGMEVDVK